MLHLSQSTPVVRFVTFVSHDSFQPRFFLAATLFSHDSSQPQLFSTMETIHVIKPTAKAQLTDAGSPTIALKYIVLDSCSCG